MEQWNFDKLWDYNNPAESEKRFRDFLEEHGAEIPLSYNLQLNTQIARTYSLRRMFDEAHKLLDEVEQQLPQSADLANARYYLERGRTYNSFGSKDKAREMFVMAKNTAEALGADFYTIDALHMLAIVAEPDEAIVINEEAMKVAELSAEPRAKNWLGALYNNTGWSYFDKGEYEKALDIFERALKFREEKQSVREIRIAKWCVARAMRALGRNEEALSIQLQLEQEHAADNGTGDGYVFEELGELYLLKGDTNNVQKYFSKAWELLGKDDWMLQNEAARMQRIKQLAAGSTTS
jgi:tetratricopeptide (TPR) repeat protein